MGLMDALRTIVGTDGPQIALAEPPAGVESPALVAAVIAEVKRSIGPVVRDGASDVRLDAVLTTQQVEPCVAVLSAALGEPCKPFGTAPLFADDALEAMVDSCGGIETGQCLFLRRCADGRVGYAALWPWSNGRSTTVRIGIYSAAVTPPPAAQA